MKEKVRTEKDVGVTNHQAQIEKVKLRTDAAEIREREMLASELSYRRLFESAQDGILILEVDTGCISDANPFLVELLGYSRSEMIGRTVGELSPFKDILPNQSMLERLQKDGYVRYDNLPLETQDGRKIAVEFVSNVYQSGDKKVIQCNIRDITERKRTENALLESKRFLRSTLDALTAHVAILDEHGVVIAVNAAWKRFASENHFMDGECGIGENYLQVCETASGEFSEEASRVADGIRAVIAGRRELFTLEYPCNGLQQKRWYGMRVTRFSGDGPVRVVVTHENISERKRSEMRLRRLVDSNAQGVIFWNTKGQITEANDAFLNLLGYTRADLEAGPLDWSAMTPPKYAELDQHALKELAETGVCLPFEKEYICKDGTLVPVLIGAATFEDAPGEGVCFVLDRTARRLLEQQYI